MGNRDDFTEATKKNLALRAAHRCSIPDCRKLTVVPHSDGEHAVLTGRAAHIYAAAPGGPRYDPKQTAEERRAPANGIWVCADHGDLIDKDDPRFPASEVRQYKRDHEAWVAQNDFVPALPRIHLQTFDGLVLPVQGPFVISGDDVQRFRDHEMEIAASSRHELRQMEILIQFPESVVAGAMAERPAGIAVTMSPKRMELTAICGSGGTVSGNGQRRPVNTFHIDIERLLPKRPVRLRFRTVQDHADALMRRVRTHKGFQEACFTYARGTFLYEDQGQYLDRNFLVRLGSDEERRFSAQDPEEFLDQQLIEMSIT